MSHELILIGLFTLIMVAFLTIDLGYLNRIPHRVTTKSAILQSLFWLSISLAFAGCILALLGQTQATEFLSAYLTEKMLSVDNLFVIMLLFGFFKLEEVYFHRVLYWGIFGAVVFRGIFIGVGSVAISHFHWILYVFGAILIYTGIKLFVSNDDDEVDFNENKVLKFAQKYLPISAAPHQGKFFTRENGKFFVTTLLVIILLVETTDILFAFDSIPAVFSISQNPFIVFTSNIFAVMGLRTLFFLVEGIMARFRFLQKGLSFVLVFIGGKMFADLFGIHISSGISFAVIIVTLLATATLSMLFPKQE